MPITSVNKLRIEGAISTLNLIRISYNKKKKPGQILTTREVRVVEPYEIKDIYLYAWDTTKGKTIKSFILNNITNVLVTHSKFPSRYPTEGKAFPTYTSIKPPDARRMRPAVNTTAFV